MLDNQQLLIETEKRYLDNLNIIDSNLSPLWMKQLESVAPDFSELLKCIQDIISVHKSLFSKLNKLVTIDYEKILSQLIVDIKVPYDTYSEHYINNINQRQDILCTPSIQQFLDDINSTKQEQDAISLESLISAPLQQIGFYKSLFNKPQLSVNPSTLAAANQLFDSLMIKNSLPPVTLDSTFYSQVDYSRVTDVLTDQHVTNFKLPTLGKVLLCDTFNCSEIAERVRLILTVDELVFCSQEDDNDDGKYTLLYKPVSIKDISIRTIRIDYELIGEYNIQLWIHQHKLLTFKARTKQDRNMWLGVDNDTNLKQHPSATSWRPLQEIVDKYDIRRKSTIPSRTKSIRPQDILTFYTDQSGEISPLVSSDEESEDESWDEERKDTASDQREQSLDKKPSSSSSSSISSPSIDATLPVSPPPPPPKETVIPQLPLEPPSTNNRPTIISGTKSLPVRNQSLRKAPPIPSNMLSPDSALNTPNSSVRPPNVRSMSAHQTPQLRNSSSSPSSPSSPVPTGHEPSSSTPSRKKPSFVRSVMAAVSNRTSLRNSKLSLKPSSESIASKFTKSAMPTSAVSLDQQSTKMKRPSDPALQRRYSAANASEPPALPFHQQMPPSPQSPFPSRHAINNQSTPSFTSNHSSSQSSLALTPPLSRSSSPGSMTPVGLSRYQTPSSSSSEDLGSPPESPDILLDGNTIKSILYKNDNCKVFHWKDESWYAMEEDCLLEVRQTYSNRSCVAVHMKHTGQLYLNAWVLPDTFICRTTDTDLSLSLHITNNQSAMENYLFHCESKQEADRLAGLLEQMHQESIKMNMVISATSTLRGAPPVLMRSSSLQANNTLTPEELQKTFKLAMQCKCKLFVQSSTAKWNSFGSVYMKVSQQYATKKMHIAMESQKSGKVTQLVSAMVQSRNVERLSAKRISFLMVDELEKNSVVYMIQVREEATGDKIFEYIKTKNADNGW